MENSPKRGSDRFYDAETGLVGVGRGMASAQPSLCPLLSILAAGLYEVKRGFNRASADMPEQGFTLGAPFGVA